MRYDPDSPAETLQRDQSLGVVTVHDAGPAMIQQAAQHQELVRLRDIDGEMPRLPRWVVIPENLEHHFVKIALMIAPAESQ